jgi:site-specific recombinase XerD
VQTTVSALQQFQNAIKSPRTKETYTLFLQNFQSYLKAPNCEMLLQKYSTKEMEMKIIDYIMYLRNERKVSPLTIHVHIAALKHFFEMNDFVGMNWKKISKYMGEFYTVAEDRPYSREEIGQLVSAAHSLRDKAIILLLSSSGLRVGGLLKLQLKDLIPLPKYSLYQITVYKKTREQYITFCTPEARGVIDQYLEFRKRMGEKLTPNSLLFRREFNRFQARTPPSTEKPLERSALFSTITRLSFELAVKEEQHLVVGQLRKGQPRSEVKALHGFRKYFATCLETEGVNPVYVELLLGHDIGLKNAYSKPTAAQLLEGNGDKVLGYVHGIDVLTINEEDRLKITVKKLTDKQDEIMVMKVKYEGDIKRTDKCYQYSSKEWHHTDQCICR